MTTRTKVTLEVCEDRPTWDSLLRSQGGHPLQLWGWGELKSKHGWQPLRYTVVGEGGDVVGAVQLLKRSLPWPFKAFYYAPRGPVVWGIEKSEFSRELSSLLRPKARGVSMVFEPDDEEDTYGNAWKKTSQNVLLSHTLVVDLTQTEDELMADMAKKTRQYIRKSIKEGVIVRPLDGEAEIQKALEIYAQTAQRADFDLHENAYYMDMTQACREDVRLYGAFYEGEMVSFLWNIESDVVAFELYGGVTDQGMQSRANYALKWFAMCDAKRRGIVSYDMNGLLNEGVSHFKQGFASHENHLVGAYELSLSPLSVAWNRGLPLAKKAFRFLRRLR